MSPPLAYPTFMRIIGGVDRAKLSMLVGAEVKRYVHYAGSNAASDEALKTFFSLIMTEDEIRKRSNHSPKNDGEPRSFFNIVKALREGRVTEIDELPERVYYWFHYGEKPDGERYTEERAHGANIDHDMFGSVLFGPSVEFDEAKIMKTVARHRSNAQEPETKPKDAPAELAEAQPIDAWRHLLDSCAKTTGLHLVPVEGPGGSLGLIRYKRKFRPATASEFPMDAGFKLILALPRPGWVAVLQEDSGQWWPGEVTDNFWYMQGEGEILIPSPEGDCFEISSKGRAEVEYKLGFVIVSGPFEVINALVSGFSYGEPVRRDHLDRFAREHGRKQIDIWVQKIVFRREG